VTPLLPVTVRALLEDTATLLEAVRLIAPTEVSEVAPAELTVTLEPAEATKEPLTDVMPTLLLAATATLLAAARV
jgi:hypothetical protein